MAITLALALRQTLTNAAVDTLDVGTTDATGDIVYLTAADGVVASGTLSNPAAGAADGGAIATFSAIEDATVTTAGTIAKFKLQDRDNTEQIRGTVTAVGGGGDLEATSLVYALNEKISTTSLTYQTP